MCSWDMPLCVWAKRRKRTFYALWCGMQPQISFLGRAIVCTCVGGSSHKSVLRLICSGVWMSLMKKIKCHGVSLEGDAITKRHTGAIQSNRDSFVFCRFCLSAKKHYVF